MGKFRNLSKKRKVLYAIVFFGTLCAGVPAVARMALHISSRSFIYTDASKAPPCRVAIILGAGVRPDGKLSTLLKDRVDKGIQLYKAGKAKKLLMSGDNRFSHYNEPERMRDYAVAQGVPKKDVATDYAGRRTYDTLYRAKHIFGLGEFIVVSQRFHLDRAIFLAKHIGVTAHGVAADVYGHRNARAEIREVPACVGALVDVYLRSPRPIMGKREVI